MKKLFVFIPVIILVVFLLNSFVLKEKEAKKEIIKEGESSEIANVIFKSTDGGQTWQDISKGLPEKLQREGVSVNSIIANDSGLYLRAGNGLYHNEPNSTTSFWTKEIFPGKQRNIIAGKNGILAYDFRGQFLQKNNGTSDWSPMYTSFQEQALRMDQTKDWMYNNFKARHVGTVFETAAGTVLINASYNLYRSADNGKTWKQVNVGGGVMKMVEANGVLLAACKDGILRSTDDGQNWSPVIIEWGDSIDLEAIDGGFAAIVNNTKTQTSSVQILMDSGKTWNTIGEDLQPSRISLLMKKIGLLSSTSNIYSIKQMGKYLICVGSDGIFRSSDMGKTWQQLLLPPAKNFGFNLSVSGNVMYIMPNKGC